jgi:2-polyprenyl-3-methyl-5-hydroxy-6-metoxy-1,4-benzoquinol methylase
MNEESVHILDAETLDLFAKKGREGGHDVPQAGQANGVKVRRIMQITRDFGRQPFSKIRILDLGCGEGVYTMEAGLRGAEVIALDARTQRMNQGAACAERHGLTNVRFIQEDVRQITREVVGSFDVVYLLGLFYHLDAPDVFAVLENLYGLCTGMLIIEHSSCPAIRLRLRISRWLC